MFRREGRTMDEVVEALTGTGQVIDAIEYTQKEIVMLTSRIEIDGTSGEWGPVDAVAAVDGGEGEGEGNEDEDEDEDED